MIGDNLYFPFFFYVQLIGASMEAKVVIYTKDQTLKKILRSVCVFSPAS